MQDEPSPLSRRIRIVLTVSAALWLSACGSESEARSKKMEELRDQLQKVQSSLQSFAHEHNLQEHETVQAAQARMMEALQDFEAYRQNHPKLQEAYDEAERWHEKMLSEEANSERYREAKVAYEAARQRLESLSEQVPDIQKARKKVEAARDSFQNALAEAAEGAGDRGEELVQRLREIQADLEKRR